MRDAPGYFSSRQLDTLHHHPHTALLKDGKGMASGGGWGERFGRKMNQENVNKSKAIAQSRGDGGKILGVKCRGAKES